MTPIIRRRNEAERKIVWQTGGANPLHLFSSNVTSFQPMSSPVRILKIKITGVSRQIHINYLKKCFTLSSGSTTHLRRGFIGHVPSDAPHLLELNSDFIECFGYHSYENVLDEPGKEEYHGAEVKDGSPPGKGVDGAVHDENPSFLWGSLIHREYTRSCNNTTPINMKRVKSESQGPDYALYRSQIAAGLMETDRRENMTKKWR